MKISKLDESPGSDNVPAFILKTDLTNTVINCIHQFEKFEIIYNQVFILGLLDYVRIALREENLNNDLFDIISRYVKDIEKIYSICNDNEICT